MSEHAPVTRVRCESGGFVFDWDHETDRATLRRGDHGPDIWRGSLLPVLRMAGDHADEFVKAKVSGSRVANGRGALDLAFGDLATGRLEIETTGFGFALRKLELTWSGAPAPLVSLHIGGGPLDERQPSAAPAGATIWPDWRADGFCVPGAKGNPGQSFWRAWDMGHAVLPLGSFGPSMGVPYTAAFPRPLLSAAMGGKAGWLAFGPGAVPAAALSLDIRASSAWLRFHLREDLWAPPAGARRVWDEPLRLSWAADAWDALARLFGSFGPHAPANPKIQRSQWGTWGNFKERRFDLDKELNSALTYGTAELQIDDLWETWNSSAVVSHERFPRFHEQLADVRAKGLGLGLWQSIGWVDRPEEVGLGAEDLLCGADGKPRVSNWAADPRTEGPSHYCIDPSSEKSRRFLVERTRRMMRELRPCMLKLDFGYGMPSPDVAAPRNPEFRGERLCFELLRIVAGAAKAEDPDVAIEFYGIHPLLRPLYDMLALDDMGDMGVHEVSGHQQRSVWAALTGAQSVAIMGSCGYFWSAIEEICLNSIVLGAPGICLPEIDGAGGSATPRITCRLRAFNRWHRRSVGWSPLWLNSHKGDADHEPRLACWGRLEGEGLERLTVLVLRDDKPKPDLSRWGIRDWTGRWAIIAQDDADISRSKRLACIPLDAGELVWARPPAGTIHAFHHEAAAGRSVSRDTPGGPVLRVSHEGELDRLEGFLIES